MLPTTKISVQKRNGNEYFYAYIPQEIAIRLGLKEGSRIMWNVSGSITNIIPYPDADVKTQVELSVRKNLKNNNVGVPNISNVFSL